MGGGGAKKHFDYVEYFLYFFHSNYACTFHIYSFLSLPLLSYYQFVSKIGL